MKRGLIVLALLGFASAAAAAPETSLRPIARGTLSAAAPEANEPFRPVARPAASAASVPEPVATAPEMASEPVEVVATLYSPQAVARSLRPTQRPKAMVQKATARRQALLRGQVCGDTSIQGEEVGPVAGQIGACGIINAVKVKSVAGVKLSTPALMDCNTATALRRWVERGAKPAIGDRGGGLKELQVAAHYACRPRNNQSGAKISEHGRGRAVDIAGFRLKDGSEITVLNGWNRKTDSKLLRRMHGSACGTFGTVLGPESDRYHQDHFHFDTARYRSGSYCR